jgi:hypothetical protein
MGRIKVQVQLWKKVSKTPISTKKPGMVVHLVTPDMPQQGRVGHR